MDTGNHVEDNGNGISMLSPQQKGEIQKFENLARFSVLCSKALKFKVHLPDFSCDEVFEMKKFLLLKAFLSDIGKFVCLTPSDRINAVWIQFIMNPCEYYAFCDGIIDHDHMPDVSVIDYVPLESEGHSKKTFSYTLQVYQEYFGYRPSGEIWTSRLYGRNSQTISSRGRDGVVESQSSLPTSESIQTSNPAKKIRRNNQRNEEEHENSYNENQGRRGRPNNKIVSSYHTRGRAGVVEESRSSLPTSESIQNSNPAKRIRRNTERNEKELKGSANEKRSPGRPRKEEKKKRT